MRRTWTSIAALAAITLGLAGPASAAVLYSDTFSRTTGTVAGGPSDWGTNDNALGGSASAAYTTTPSRGGGANQVTSGTRGTLINGSARTGVDVTSLAPLGYTAEFTFTRGPAGNGYIAVGIGGDPTANPLSAGGAGDATATPSDFAVLFQQPVGTNVGGNTQVFKAGVLVDPAVNGQPGSVDYGTSTDPHTLLLTVVPQAAGDYSAGALIDVSFMVDADPLKSYSTTITSDGAGLGYLTWSTNRFNTEPATPGPAYGLMMVDNLVVTALVPEPTTGVLAALAVCGLIRRRA